MIAKLKNAVMWLLLMVLLASLLLPLVVACLALFVLAALVWVFLVKGKIC